MHLKSILTTLLLSFILSIHTFGLDNSEKIKILIDTDANNELDDQHALAYAFLNSEVFDIVGVTVNNTRNGFGIQGQYDEAQRIIQLFNLENDVPLFMGADKNYDEIAPTIERDDFDGHAAVDFIIKEALKMDNEKLVLVPVGKLTNIALAILKEPRIVEKVRVVWLGANYPYPGEYNLVNDTTSVNPVIESGVDFEIVTVRYGHPTGTDAVRVTPDEVKRYLKGKGPVSSQFITGRHGGEFNCFGDYSANLFEHAQMHGNPPSRALFDMVAVAILKNKEWGERSEIPAPILKGDEWIDRPGNSNKIVIWENFDRDGIVNDLFELMAQSTRSRIMPWSVNPEYWQYKGEPLMLLGASGDDNLFQWPEELLIPHLDSMQEAGANYVRNTMSDRQDKGFELYPFSRLENGKYDLDQLNEDYFNRFDFFLQETAKRDIIVQIEIWDRFDYARNHWPVHPFNPENNVSYSEESSGLDLEYPDHPARNKQPFFFTTPKQRNNEILLKYQKARVNRILDIALKYDHVLYCMDNETSAEEAWAVYWAELVLNRAEAENKMVCVTEMWDNWDLTTEHHKRTFDHPERYVYCDVSQNNQKKGQVHWDNFQWVKDYVSTTPRPLNTVKTYGADGGRHGDTKNGIERWWRHVIGGAASARFHRPPSGLGLSELSLNCVKTARVIESYVPFWELEPRNALLSEREENEAYLAYKEGGHYVVFFTDGGEVKLDLSNESGTFGVTWFSIRSGNSSSGNNLNGGEKCNLTCPGKSEWIALISK